MTNDPTTFVWRTLKLSLLGLTLGVFASGAQADQIQGTPGTTSATRVLSGQQLPAADLPFKGKIANIAQDSTPY